MVTPSSPVPRRGDIIIIDFNPQAGREQAGKRPALVLSPSEYNAKVGLAIVCPVTNQAKGYPFEVDIPQGLTITGVILADHVKSLDWRTRDAKVICQVPQTTVDDVLKKLNALTGPVVKP